MRSIFIFGRGGHARVIASLLNREAIFIDRTDEEQFFKQIDDHRKADIYLGIGNDKVRRKIFEKLRSFDISPAVCIGPNTFIAKTASIGIGTVICPGA